MSLLPDYKDTSKENLINQIIESLKPNYEISSDPHNNKNYIDIEKNLMVEIILLPAFDNIRTLIPISLKKVSELRKSSYTGILYVLAFKDETYTWLYDESKIFLEFDYSGSEYSSIAKNFLIDKKNLVLL